MWIYRFFFLVSAITQITKAQIKIVITSAAGPHRGASTHHQDQLITSVNFNPMNKIASNPKNPMPLAFASALVAISFPRS